MRVEYRGLVRVLDAAFLSFPGARARRHRRRSSGFGAGGESLLRGAGLRDRSPRRGDRSRPRPRSRERPRRLPFPYGRSSRPSSRPYPPRSGPPAAVARGAAPASAARVALARAVPPAHRVLDQVHRAATPSLVRAEDQNELFFPLRVVAVRRREAKRLRLELDRARRRALRAPRRAACDAHRRAVVPLLEVRHGDARSAPQLQKPSQVVPAPAPLGPGTGRHRRAADVLEKRAGRRRQLFARRALRTEKGDVANGRTDTRPEGRGTRVATVGRVESDVGGRHDDRFRRSPPARLARETKPNRETSRAKMCG